MVSGAPPALLSSAGAAGCRRRRGEPGQRRLQRPDTAPLANVTAAGAEGAPSPAQGAPSSHTPRDTPTTNLGGHPTSESRSPALSSPTPDTFLSEPRSLPISGVPRSSWEPVQRALPPPLPHPGTGTHPPGPPPARRDPVPAPPGGRARPACSDRSTSRPRPPASKLPGPAPAPAPGAGRQGSHPRPPARPPAPGLTWRPPRRGGAGGGGSGWRLEKEVRAGGRRKWGGRAGRPGRGAGAGRGGAPRTRKSAGRGPPPSVSPPLVSPRPRPGLPHPLPLCPYRSGLPVSSSSPLPRPPPRP